MQTTTRLGPPLSQFLHSFAGPRATAPALGLGVLLFLSIGTAFTDLKQESSQQLAWNGIAFQSFLLAGGWFLIGALITNIIAPLFGSVRVMSLGILFFTTEMFRAIFVGVVAVDEGLSPEVYWTYRIVAGGLTGLTLLGLGSVLVNDSSTYRTELSDLMKAQAEAETAMSVTEAELTAERTALLATVQQSITAALNAVLDKPRKGKAQANEVVNELVKVSDEVIRPLSHELFDFSVRKGARTQLPTRPTFRRVFELATLRSPFKAVPVLVIAFLLIVGAALFSFEDPIPGVIGLIVILVWLGCTLVVADRFVHPVMTRWRSVTRAVVASVILLLIAAPPILGVAYIGNLNFEEDYPYLIYTLVITLLLGWSFGLYLGLVAGRDEILSQQQHVVDRLNWANARLGAQLWRDQSEIAKSLHNDVQGAVIAAALSLQKALAEGSKRDEAIAEVRRVLTESTTLRLHDETDISVTRHIEDLSTRWSGILNFDLDIAPDAVQRLAQDPVCTRCARDFMTEFVTNSVKHGHARSVWFGVSVPEHNVLRLEMRNDGLPFTGQGKPGMGARLVETQSLKTSYENVPGGGVIATADLALV